MARSSRYVNVAALSRNRDNNRNGLIDLDEIVWYVPAKEQMMHLYVGTFLMDDPLYQARLQKGDNLCYATSTFDASKGLAILVANKGAAIDWMKDGSFSETDRKNCYIRCARNLGTPPVMQAHAPYTGTGYAHEGLAFVSPAPGSTGVNYIITYNKLSTTALRSYIGVGSLGSHTQFQAAAVRIVVLSRQNNYFTGQVTLLSLGTRPVTYVTIIRNRPIARTKGPGVCLIPVRRWLCCLSLQIICGIRLSVGSCGRVPGIVEAHCLSSILEWSMISRR